jgi:hypothetical protein
MFEPQKTTPSCGSDTTTVDDESRLKLAMKEIDGEYRIKLRRIDGKYRSRRFRLMTEWRKNVVAPCAAVQSERQQALLDNEIAQLDEKAAVLSYLRKGFLHFEH